jgi:hypothetical protein
MVFSLLDVIDRDADDTGDPRQSDHEPHVYPCSSLDDTGMYVESTVAFGRISAVGVIPVRIWG